MRSYTGGNTEKYDYHYNQGRQQPMSEQKASQATEHFIEETLI
jgi:hypothetical protein